MPRWGMSRPGELPSAGVVERLRVLMRWLRLRARLEAHADVAAPVALAEAGSTFTVRLPALDVATPGRARAEGGVA